MVQILDWPCRTGIAAVGNFQPLSAITTSPDSPKSSHPAVTQAAERACENSSNWPRQKALLTGGTEAGRYHSRLSPITTQDLLTQTSRSNGVTSGIPTGENAWLPSHGPTIGILILLNLRKPSCHYGNWPFHFNAPHSITIDVVWECHGSRPTNPGSVIRSARP